MTTSSDRLPLLTPMSAPGESNREEMTPADPVSAKRKLEKMSAEAALPTTNGLPVDAARLSTASGEASPKRSKTSAVGGDGDSAGSIVAAEPSPVPPPSPPTAKQPMSVEEPPPIGSALHQPPKSDATTTSAEMPVVAQPSSVDPEPHILFRCSSCQSQYSFPYRRVVVVRCPVCSAVSRLPLSGVLVNLQPSEVDNPTLFLRRGDRKYGNSLYCQALTWTVNQLSVFLQNAGLTQLCPAFERNFVDGRMFLCLTEDQIRQDLGILDPGDISGVMAVIDLLTENRRGDSTSQTTVPTVVPAAASDAKVPSVQQTAPPSDATMEPANTSSENRDGAAPDRGTDDGDEDDEEGDSAAEAEDSEEDMDDEMEVEDQEEDEDDDMSESS